MVGAIVGFCCLCLAGFVCCLFIDCCFCCLDSWLLLFCVLYALGVLFMFVIVLMCLL